MPITKSQAEAHRGEFHHVTLRNADGTPARCRPNGACKTWKTRPGDFQLPVKHGLKTHFYITERNADEWCTSAEEAKELGKLVHAPKIEARLLHAERAFKANPTPAGASIIRQLKNELLHL
jgi:hypothetical protein